MASLNEARILLEMRKRIFIISPVRRKESGTGDFNEMFEKIKKQMKIYRPKNCRIYFRINLKMVWDH